MFTYKQQIQQKNESAIQLVSPKQSYFDYKPLILLFLFFFNAGFELY